MTTPLDATAQPSEPASLEPRGSFGPALLEQVAAHVAGVGPLDGTDIGGS